MKTPPLPKHAFSILGPVPVVRKRMEGLLGLCDTSNRTITIQPEPTIARDTAWATFWHECVHMALWDGGVKLGHKAEEHICDVLGTYLAAAVRQGYLKVKPCPSSPAESPAANDASSRSSPP